ncbi:MAG: hypothetical protein PHI79_01915 [Sulfurovaceae bacterium]|nr:hypothetical protein [Sulfurovaceae bacterium]MDD5548331.1 hypothetical protein [Sulfurovaceae bacterium]
MNENSYIKFLLGTVIGGLGAYYALKHQDEIMDKIHQLEEEYKADSDKFVESAKDKLHALTKSIQSKLEEFRGDAIENKNESIDAIMEELNHLRKEVAKFKA